MSKLKSNVSVGTLKNKLSAYLKMVKVGNEFVVTEHNHPVAKIIPFDLVSDELKIVPAKTDSVFLMKMAESDTKEKDYQSLEGLRRDRGDR
jgi:prevent-host-death family protein